MKIDMPMWPCVLSNRYGASYQQQRRSSSCLTCLQYHSIVSYQWSHLLSSGCQQLPGKSNSDMHCNGAGTCRLVCYLCSREAGVSPLAFVTVVHSACA